LRRCHKPVANVSQRLVHRQIQQQRAHSRRRGVTGGIGPLDLRGRRTVSALTRNGRAGARRASAARFL
jgi:hypothetical protein